MVLFIFSLHNCLSQEPNSEQEPYLVFQIQAFFIREIIHFEWIDVVDIDY